MPTRRIATAVNAIITDARSAYSIRELPDLSRQKRKNISHRLKTHSRGLHITNGIVPIIGDPASLREWWDGEQAVRALLPRHALCTCCDRKPVASELQYQKKRLHPSMFTTACFVSCFWCSRRRLPSRSSAAWCFKDVGFGTGVVLS